MSVQGGNGLQNNSNITVTYFVYRGHRKCRTRKGHAVFLF